MRPRSRAWLTSAAAVISLGALWAQKDQAIFRTDTREVVCHTTVVDKNNHLITNLTGSFHGI